MLAESSKQGCHTPSLASGGQPGVYAGAELCKWSAGEIMFGVPCPKLSLFTLKQVKIEMFPTALKISKNDFFSNARLYHHEHCAPCNLCT